MTPTSDEKFIKKKKNIKKNREIVFEMTKNSSSFQNRILNSLKKFSL